MAAKHGETGRLSVHFRADDSGRLTPSHAEAVVDVLEEYTVKVPVASKAGGDGGNVTVPAEAEEVGGRSYPGSRGADWDEYFRLG